MFDYRYIVLASINLAMALANIEPGIAQVPNYLNPSPNPLQFPTRPEEVKIQGTQPITLQQALELARRNNLELQGALIQVERSRAALREVQADMYPTIRLNVGLSRLQSVAKQLSTKQPEKTQFANQRNNIQFEVEQADSALQSNLQNVQTATVAVEQAREALRLARLRFQAGVGTQTDIMNQETALARSENQRSQAILNYNRALTQLQRAIPSRF